MWDCRWGWVVARRTCTLIWRGCDVLKEMGHPLTLVSPQRKLLSCKNRLPVQRGSVRSS